MILGAAYSLWLYNRAVLGNVKPNFLYKFSDPNGREVTIFLPLIVGGATVELPKTYLKFYGLWALQFYGQAKWSECDHDICLRIAGAREYGGLINNG
jgi:NADH-ubiquinone oxidoreductase chain 4